VTKPTDSQPKSTKGTFFKARAGRYLTIFFISAWMFALGVLVGRGTAPVKFDIDRLNRELASLKKADLQAQLDQIKAGPKEPAANSDLDFYEELKKSDARPAADPSAPQPLGKAPTTDATAVKPTAPAQPTTGTSGAAKARTAVPLRAGAHGRPIEKPLTIQAASLQDPQEADAVVSRLRRKGFPAFKTIAIVPERGIWFRIRVGRYATREAAAPMMLRLKAEGFDPFVVRQDG
jgi:cell division septation protein DedD